jgi:hypothetical protein
VNKLIWRQTHAVFKLEGVAHTYVRSRIYKCVLRSPSRFPLVMHPHKSSSFNTKHRDPEEQPLLSKDSPTQFRCVVTASSGNVVPSCVFGSWICMEKFNSEKSSGTYRRNHINRLDELRNNNRCLTTFCSSIGLKRTSIPPTWSAGKLHKDRELEE